MITLRFYFDYKSPFSFLAKDQVYKLEKDYRVRVEYIPYYFPVENFASADEGFRMKKVRYTDKELNRRSSSIIVEG